MRFMKILAVVLVVAAMAVSLPVADASAARIRAKVGDAAPDFTLPIYGGGDFKLSDNKGKTILLTVFQSACTSCKSELQFLNDFVGKDVEIIAINVDAMGGTERGDQLLKTYIESMGLKMTFLVDPQFTVGRMYGVAATPGVILIDKEGKFTAMHIGFMDEDKADLEKMMGAK